MKIQGTALGVTVVALLAGYALPAGAQKKPDPIAYTDQKVLEEATARAAADTTLTTNLADETSARAAADTSINAKLGTVQTKLGQLDQTDAALSQADQALSTALTDLQGKVDGLTGAGPTSYAAFFEVPFVPGSSGSTTITSTAIPGASIAVFCNALNVDLTLSGSGWTLVRTLKPILVQSVVYAPLTKWYLHSQAYENPAYPTKVLTLSSLATDVGSVCKGQIRLTIDEKF